MNILKGLKPQKVFRYFEEISAIPRGSGKTDKIRDYCVEFAVSHDLEYVADDAGNIIIFKEANCKTDSDPIIIQGHLDMVWEKNEKGNINFETDGLELAVDGDFLFAKGTTLGGDDGIAVAMCLALLDSDDIVHPPLEIILTADEEVGMSGAMGIDTSVLKSKRMINLDSEAEGILWVSCAGGARVNIYLHTEYENTDKKAYSVIVSGLHGGHSGTEIDKGYANANKIMGRILSMLSEKCKYNLIEMNGGKMDNAITRESICTLASDEDIISAVKEISHSITGDYKTNDPEISVSVISEEKAEKSMTQAATRKAVEILNELPNGIIDMSKEMDGLVETSLNLGTLKTENNVITYRFSVRSSVDSEKDKLCNTLRETAEKYGCEISIEGSYPAWEFKKDSVLRDTMSEIYREMFGKDMTVTAIHAGLECGLFCGKINGLDCVSLGPDIFDIHTPEERLSISSSERVWNYLLRVLETI